MRVIFAGGGTGGHLFPALAIAEEVRVREPAAAVLFVGTKDKIEARVVPQLGWEFRTIWISGFHRTMRLSNVLFPVKVLVSLVQSIAIIRKFKPDVVVGTGGYVAGPVLRAAIMRGVPTLLQEGNSYPGVTTRVLASKVRELHLTFESSRKYFARQDNIFVTGHPTRPGLASVTRSEGLSYFGMAPGKDQKTLLVFGGSLGAHTINRAVEKHLQALMANNVRLLWQTGKEDFPWAQSLAAALAPAGGEVQVWVSAFIDRMDCAYQAADLVVARSGATTIAEIVRLGKPAILVPYPHAAADHQTENARSLVEAGAAELVVDSEVEEKLLGSVLAAFSPGTLSRMSAKSLSLARPGAAAEIANHVLALAQEEGGRR
jgi:UDP-N-acetylglucosamine--N-acetylmuramyl-(pentapeptide) pyrophosphoryl-undecaprenol N-acetylglucosamine transferase